MLKDEIGKLFNQRDLDNCLHHKKHEEIIVKTPGQ